MSWRTLDDVQLIHEFLAWWDTLPAEKQEELKGDHTAITAAFIASRPPFRSYR